MLLEMFDLQIESILATGSDPMSTLSALCRIADSCVEFDGDFQVMNRTLVVQEKIELANGLRAVLNGKPVT